MILFFLTLVCRLLYSRDPVLVGIVLLLLLLNAGIIIIVSGGVVVVTDLVVLDILSKRVLGLSRVLLLLRLLLVGVEWAWLARMAWVIIVSRIAATATPLQWLLRRVLVRVSGERRAVAVYGIVVSITATSAGNSRLWTGLGLGRVRLLLLPLLLVLLLWLGIVLIPAGVGRHCMRGKGLVGPCEVRLGERGEEEREEAVGRKRRGEGGGRGEERGREREGVRMNACK